ncbi:restriction endonuclease subunit S [Veillonella criceti]|nr:restriction endonuclease subunit S [Veillonella criceti]SUP79518.1 Type I restriction modification DNA specificity domain [Veillonella criceti]
MINITNNVENWQQLKLFDVLEIPIKERLENPALNKLITVGLNLTGIRVGSARETLDIGATTYYVRRKGQLIYGKQNFFNGSMAIIDDKYDGYATSIDVPALNINNNKVDSKFLYYYISRPCYYKRTEAQAIGTGSKRIHEKTLLSFEIYLPPLATQKKIAKLINNIEKYIAKQNVLLNNYINIKNKYLQLLFI